MAISLDLAKAYRHKQYGDLLAVLTWVNNERALVVLPAFRKAAGWFVLEEPAAYKYLDPSYLASSAARACQVMGIEATPRNCVKVGEIIMDQMEDLIRMPDEPDERKKVGAAIGEARLYAEGELMHGEDVRLPVNG